MLLEKPYQRERAVEYAMRWALDRNPLFTDFTDVGGNCTNFVSQCILAGSCTMNYTVDFGWYYVSADDRAPAWTSVDYFYDFMTGTPLFAEQNGGVGPYAEVVTRDRIQIGDIIQFANRAGRWYHTVLVCGFDGSEILVCAQSDNAKNRPLSSYTNAVDYRFLHVQGVRIEVNDDLCYQTLLAGTELPPIEESTP